MYSLKGKVALVTGAARQHGMGRAIALRLAQEGADVVISGKQRPQEEFPEWEKRQGWRGLASVLEEIEALGRKSLAITTDVSSSKEVSDMVAAAIKKFGKIDILVNNAGVTAATLGKAPVTELDEKIWEKALTINLTGPFLCSKAVARHMVERGEGGKIINIASDRAKMGAVGTAAYCASKFGLLGLTQSMALELALHKISVNAVCPGVVMTDPGAGGFIKKESSDWGVSFEEARERHYAQAAAIIPLGRVATVEDVANVVAFLASSQSDYITGQAINLTGGRIMH